MIVKLELHGEKTGDFGGIGMVGHSYGYAGIYQGPEGPELRCYEERCRIRCFREKQKNGVSLRYRPKAAACG